MASISANGSKGHHKFTLTVTETSTSVANNTSAISWSFVLSSLGGGYDWNYSSTVPVTYSITVNGTTYTGNIMKYDGSSTVTVRSGTMTVAHNSDGNKSISFSFSVSSLNYSYLPGSASNSGTMALTFIARKSAPSVNVSSLNFGSAVTISTNRKSTSFTHRLYYKYGSVSWIEITSSASVTDSYSWTVPLTLMNQIPKATSLAITICCSTYSGSNWIGEDYAYITANVPSTIVPTIGGISWTKTSTEPSTWPMTQGVSKGTMAMTGVSGAYGSTISTYSLTFAGLSSTTSSLTVGHIASSGTLKAVAKVTDSRGRSATKEVSFTVTAYSKPQLTVSVYRSDSAGAEDDYGEYMYVKASVTVTAVGNNALQSLVLQYKKHADSTYTSVTLTNGTAKIIAASSDYTWDWIITATDRVNPASENNSISTGEVVLDILADGTGIGLGKVAEIPNMVDVAEDWDLGFGTVPVGDHIIAQGTNGAWTYRKWASGISECWRTTVSTTLSFAGTTGLGCWYGTTQPIFDFPTEAGFTTAPTVTQTCNSGGAIIVSSITAVTATQVKLTYGRFYGGNDNYAVTFHIHAYGRWK